MPGGASQAGLACNPLAKRPRQPLCTRPSCPPPRQQSGAPMGLHKRAVVVAQAADGHRREGGQRWLHSALLRRGAGLCGCRAGPRDRLQRGGGPGGGRGAGDAIARPHPAARGGRAGCRCQGPGAANARHRCARWVRRVGGQGSGVQQGRPERCRRGVDCPGIAKKAGWQQPGACKSAWAPVRQHPRTAQAPIHSGRIAWALNREQQEELGHWGRPALGRPEEPRRRRRTGPPPPPPAAALDWVGRSSRATQMEDRRRPGNDCNASWWFLTPAQASSTWAPL